MKFSGLAAAFGAALAVMFAGAASAQTLYGASGNNVVSNLYTINPATGVSAVVGPIGYAVTGLAYNSSTGVMYGSTSSNSPVASNSIITINLTSGAGTLVGSTGLSGPVADLAWSGSVMYGWSEGTDDLVTINLATGAGTIVSDSGVGTSGDSMSFVGGVLYGALAGTWYSINTTTGIPTAIAPVTGVGGNANGGTTQPGTNVFFSSANDGNLYTINVATGVGTLVGNPGIPNFDAIEFNTPPTATVPTLSEWAMIGFAGLLAMAGALWVQRRRFLTA